MDTRISFVCGKDGNSVLLVLLYRTIVQRGVGEGCFCLEVPLGRSSEDLEVWQYIEIKNCLSI